MKVEVEDISAVEKKVTVEIPPEQVRDEFELAYKEVQKKAHLKGFRPGKAPMKIIETHFRDYVREQVLKKLLKESLEPALDRKQLQPIIEPEIELGELKEDESFSYTMKVDLKPEVELNRYQGFELEQEILEVSNEMVEKALQDLRERQAIYQEVKEERGIKEGDLVSLNLKAELEGKPLAGEGGDGLQYPVGVESYIPGFKDQLLGLQPKEKKSFQVKFPEDHIRKNLAGKTVDYAVEIIGIKKKIVPELDDEFAKETGIAENLEGLRNKIKENLKKRAEEGSRIRLERAILDKLVEANSLEVPKRLVKKHSQELAWDWFQQLGIKEPGQEEFEKIVEQFKARAERELKAGFILEAVIAKEGIKLGPEEEEDKIKQMAEQYQIDPEKLKSQLQEGVLERLRQKWLEDKALDFLLSVSKIDIKRASPNDSSAVEKSENGQEEGEE